jgi:hypothetical protein
MDFFMRVWAVIRDSPLVNRTIVLDVVQGILVGAGLNAITASSLRTRGERSSPMLAGAPRGRRPATTSLADRAGRERCRLG